MYNDNLRVHICALCRTYVLCTCMFKFVLIYVCTCVRVCVILCRHIYTYLSLSVHMYVYTQINTDNCARMNVRRYVNLHRRPNLHRHPLGVLSPQQNKLTCTVALPYTIALLYTSALPLHISCVTLLHSLSRINPH